jgi:two-component system chemotaxis response regulator CheB
MLVDDSAVIRGATARILEKDPEISIASSVSNGEMAIVSAKKLQPNIIILDIEMPVMDGLTALPKILEASPRSKIIMFSTLTEKGAAISMKAMALGAVECLVKPTSVKANPLAANVKSDDDFGPNLIRLIKSLGSAAMRLSSASKPMAVPTPSSTAQVDAQPEAPPHSLVGMPPGVSIKMRDDLNIYKGKPDILAIGSSTGGPQALLKVLSECGKPDVPVIITQHMPATFTKILAQHINTQTGLPACEGETGMALQKGHVYVAPGGKHMLLEMKDGKPHIILDDGPQENFCKPAVDPMLRSALKIYGKKMLVTILTGMGSDGLHGAKAAVEAGCRLIAQDEASSVVWGMPGAVAKAGICNAVLPLDEIGLTLKKAMGV